ncbi:LPXTG cell wall anchor domain-containing protein [Microbacterium sp. JZ37]|nr:LPXTG cell wall anchor domain-containing protein [Microbacterium sp. JZ37]
MRQTGRVTTTLLSASTALASTGNDLVPWIVGGAVVLVLAGAGLLVLRRRQ